MNQAHFARLICAASLLTVIGGTAVQAQTVVAPAAAAATAATKAKSPNEGGPYDPMTSAIAEEQTRALFMTWKKLDTVQQGTIAVPSVQPVQHLSYTSNFGVRSDPFRGTAAFHAGVDIQGAIGTPVYATADGFVDRAGRANGYGNLIELDHGKGIQTRYGHLSKILVAEHSRVHRGDLIGLIGSTGRSTGPHLHYEVRIDGAAINPVPFLQNADYFAVAHANPTALKPVVATTVPESTD